MARISKEEQARIRQSILEVSGKLFVEQGYEHTSTKSIAKEVGIAEGTLFNYFKTKTDLFIEVATVEYFDIDYDSALELKLKEDVAVIYTEYLLKASNRIVVLPKKVTLEFFLAILHKLRRKPEQIMKYAEMDLRFIDEMESLTKKLIECGMIIDCNARDLSELVYSTVLFELFIYLYEKNMKKEMMIDRVRRKVDMVLHGYIIKR